jgi:hypothetical protein
MQTQTDSSKIYKERIEKLEQAKLKIDEIKSKMSILEKELLEIKKLDKILIYKDDINKSKLKKKKIYKVDDILFWDKLMYQRFPPKRVFSWQEAIDYAKTLTIGQYQNWRLPTIDELERLFTKQSNKNSLGDSHFIIKELLEVMPKESCFWSSSEENEPYAWVADFSRGYDYWRKKELNYHAIFVRDIKL